MMKVSEITKKKSGLLKSRKKIILICCFLLVIYLESVDFIFGSYIQSSNAV